MRQPSLKPVKMIKPKRFQYVGEGYSPYLEFDRKKWCRLRKDTPLTLTEQELSGLTGENEPVSLPEVEEIYLPLSRLLSLYASATQGLYCVTGEFLDHPAPKVPYVIGVCGSVAVGKSTTSRILRALLSRWPDHPRVAWISTDAYLYPNAVLEERGLMQRKGFPESYQLFELMRFLADLKAGKPNLKVPVYSHHHYDILPNQFRDVDQPDIVIVEGLNILQTGKAELGQPWRLFLSDFFDFTVYVDAETPVIKQWYIERFMAFCERAVSDNTAYFQQFSRLSNEEARAFAERVWTDINEANLLQHILPFRERASLILEKGEDHLVKRVLLRKL